MHTANVHDPILSAVQEAQPFEQAVKRVDDDDPSGEDHHIYRKILMI